jgi:aspartyl-tRNA(Asn)/glutamyl-tRNA(Gln) amidotransferase subunit A
LISLETEEFGAIGKFQRDLFEGRISCEEATRKEISNISRYNREFNAFITLFDREEDIAFSEARRLDKKLSGMRLGSLKEKERRLHPLLPLPPLFGVLFSIKDNIFLKDRRTTAASGAFKDFVPKINAEVVDLIIRFGGIIVGKTNLHELALGATSSSSYFGPVRNPRDSSRISGGSSGGSAVSVALSDEKRLVSLGTDTGGSVRIPAALSGVFGFKPTLSSISTVGVFPLSATLDHVGILANSIQDISLVYHALSSAKKHDNSKSDDALSKSKAKSQGLIRLGVASEFFTEEMDKYVSSTFWAAVEKLKGFDDSIKVVDEVDVSICRKAYYPRRKIQLGEAAWFYKELISSKSKRRLLQPDVRRLLDIGSKVGEIGQMFSQILRLEFALRLAKIFNEIDYLLTPTCPIVAPKLDDILGHETGPTRYLLIRNTEPFNLAGFPALSIPAPPSSSLVRGSLPVGIQIVGNFGEDEGVLRAGLLISKILG